MPEGVSDLVQRKLKDVHEGFCDWQVLAYTQLASKFTVSLRAKQFTS